MENRLVNRDEALREQLDAFKQAREHIVSYMANEQVLLLGNAFGFEQSACFTEALFAVANCERQALTALQPH